ncbi:MAG TPA: 2-oxo acid dehydrogenase subunit E2 [Caulobacteraceae bacterium]|jgi:2-oxoglutarate dehydrogenase E2 component (dihydrolipoamide succinyltransferase)|nr:2-oxo acid dehydrogenase subunit E2 [Caulobacteraceae bacterium]
MTAAAEIRAPIEQEGTKAVVRKWLKAVGQAVRADEPVVELETDKVAVEVAAEADGVLTEIVLAAGADAEPGALLGRMEPIGLARSAATPKPEAKPDAKPDATDAKIDWPMRPPRRRMAAFDPDLNLSPSVRRLLAEADIEPTGLRGSGRDGRLTRQDVENEVLRREKEGVAPAAASAVARTEAPLAGRASQSGARSIPHDSMRKRIAEHMTHSLSTAPHVTAVFEADFTAVVAHRARSKAEFAQKGVNLTYTAYLVSAAAQAMAAAPTVNSRWYEDRLEVFDAVNVGVGTALGDKGLVVPVIRDAQALAMFDIAQQLQDLTERARADRLIPADVQGGTFSISNHGVSGSLIAAPIIIAQPQSAILGVGKLEKRVVVREVGGADAIQVRPMAYVSLTIDHRVVDAHQTNAWLSRFVEVIEGWR